jgi:hypothetical protein
MLVRGGENETKTTRVRLPVQAAVDRTATYATLAEGFSIQASQVQDSDLWWPHFTLVDPPNLVGFPLLRWTNAPSGSLADQAVNIIALT